MEDRYEATLLRQLQPSVSLVTWHVPRGAAALPLLTGAALLLYAVLQALWAAGLTWGYGAAEVPPQDRPLHGITAVLSLVLGVSLGRVAVWIARRPAPRLEVGPTELVVEMPSVLVEPLRIPRDAVEAALVDEEAASPQPRYRRRTLPRRVADGATEWLYTLPGPPRLPVIGSGRELPNVAIVLRYPVSPSVRRRPWLFADPYRHYTVRRGRSLQGFLLQAADLQQARSLFASAGLLEECHRGAEEEAGGSRLVVVGALLTVAWVVILAIRVAMGLEIGPFGP